MLGRHMLGSHVALPIMYVIKALQTYCTPVNNIGMPLDNIDMPLSSRQMSSDNKEMC